MRITHQLSNQADEALRRSQEAQKQIDARKGK
jgi:hypothetical protein